jgi:Protein of unknown function (DUF5674)
MQIVRDKITLDELKKMSEKMYNRLVKAVVDIEKEIMALDVEMHADAELALLEEESQQEYLWGINFYPELDIDHWIEFDSIINIRPGQGNRTRSVEDKGLQEKIKKIVNRMVVR